MGNFIELVFHRFFLGMIATAYFWLLTLAGGVIFGIAPASATLMSLFAENGYSARCGWRRTEYADLGGGR